MLDHELRLAAERYTPKDENSIPTGELAAVAGTPLDFRQRRRLGERIGDLTGHEAVGYDHNFVLDNFNGAVRLVAELWDPASGRIMRVHTDQPGVQLYTGNHVWGQTCKGGRVYGKHSAVCLETQHFPDSPNKPHFPSTILRPGETYRQVCIYEFDCGIRKPPRTPRSPRRWDQPLILESTKRLQKIKPWLIYPPLCLRVLVVTLLLPLAPLASLADHSNRMSTISNRLTPAGTWTSAFSPFFFPNSPCASGLTTLILPAS